MELKLANVHDALNNEKTARWVPGYKGMYKVTYNGMVYSYIKNKFLKPGLSGKNYLTVALFPKRTHYVHRLVATAFLPNPENKATVNHKDGNKIFNHVVNLEHATFGENNSHALRTGLKRSAYPAKGVIQIDMQGNEIARYHSSEHAPVQFSSGNICHVANGKRNHHGGFKWAWINK